MRDRCLRKRKNDRNDPCDLYKRSVLYPNVVCVSLRHVRFAFWAIFALVALVCGCEPPAHRHRPTSRETAQPMFHEDGDVSAARDGSVFQIPAESNPGIVQSPPVDLGWSQCPGVRILRIDRHFNTDAAPTPSLPPRYYGRDEQGRIWSMKEVLSCELRNQHWITKGHPEGNNLILWRGPWIFHPDGDCEWREPVRTEIIPGGRRIHLRERCRRRNHPGPVERTVVVDVRDDHRTIVMQ